MHAFAHAYTHTVRSNVEVFIINVINVRESEKKHKNDHRLLGKQSLKSIKFVVNPKLLLR